MKYSIEDFEWIVNNPTTCTNPNDPVYQRYVGIRSYFIEHPEELVECERCKQRGYDAQTIKRILKGEISGFF